MLKETDFYAIDRCGGQLQVSSTTRTLQSLGYPRGYPSNIECIWTMTTTAESVINLDFTSFVTEACCDYLSVS